MTNIDLGLDIDTNYRKYKKCCINQNLSNIRSSIDEKLSNTEAQLKKSVAYKKSV